MAAPTATCVWRLTDELVLALHHRLGAPVDSYANGSQTWLRADGPGGMPIEWRLHPQPDFARPGRVSSYHLFPVVVGPLVKGEPPEIEATVAWSGLEASPAYGDPIDPAELASLLGDQLGIHPDASGLIDRDGLGAAWERSGGRIDVVDRLIEMLSPPPD